MQAAERLAARRPGRRGVALVVRSAAAQEALARCDVVLARLVGFLGDIALDRGHARLLLGALERIPVSPRTVEYHLHKVFTKLAISSRTQLYEALPNDSREPQPV